MQDRTKVEIKLAIRVNEKDYDVDPVVFKGISALFARLYADIPIPDEPDKTACIDIDQQGAKLKHKEYIPKFIKICHEPSTNLSIQDLFELLLVASEWEAPLVVNKLKQALEKVAHPEKMLEFLFKSKDKDPELINLVAAHMNELNEIPSFCDLPPEILCMLIDSPYCRRPQRDLFDQLIVKLIKKYEYKCVSLAKHIDFITTDLQLLIDLSKALTNISMLSMYPNLNRIIELRQCEQNYKNMVQRVATLEIEKQELAQKVVVLEEKGKLVDALKQQVSTLQKANNK